MTTKPLYGDVLYGEAIYGGAADPSLMLWIIEIDWDNDGYFGQGSEADRCVSVSVKRGRENLIKANDEQGYTTIGSGFEQVGIGEAVLLLDNHDGRYDAWNNTSPLYPNVAPGRAIRIMTFESGVFYPIFVGYIEDPLPVMMDDRHYVRIKALDGIKRLAEQLVTIAPLSAISVDEAIIKVLEKAEWTAPVQLDQVPSYLMQFWVNDEPARKVIQEITDANFSRFFVDAQGRARLIGLYDGRTTKQTFSEMELHKDVSLPTPWGPIYNRINIAYQVYRKQSPSVVWAIDDNTLLDIGETRVVWADFSFGGELVAASDMSVPVGGSTFEANSLPDGTGADLTSKISVGVDYFPEKAKIILANQGTARAYITKLELWGTPIVMVNGGSATQENTASQKTYKKRDLQVKNKWQQDAGQAVMYGKFLLAILAQPNKFPVLTVEYYPKKQFDVDLYDIVQIDIPFTGIHQEKFRVAGIEHQSLDDNLIAFRTMLYLEPTINYSGIYWTFDTQIGITSIFGF